MHVHRFQQNIRAVVFDVFGTLLDFGEQHSPYLRLMRWMHAGGRRPTPSDARLILTQQAELRTISSLFGLIPPESVLQDCENALRADLLSIKLFTDTISTLSRLRSAGLQIGICSNLAAPYGEKVIELLPKMDVYTMSYAVGSIKPEPRIYQVLTDQLQLEAAKIIFVGDTANADRDGSTSIGMDGRLIQRSKGQMLEDVLSDVWG